jgi:hypothetical protein
VLRPALACCVGLFAADRPHAAPALAEGSREGRGLRGESPHAQAAQRHARQEAAGLGCRGAAVELAGPAQRRTGGKAAEVARVRITAAGRMALADEGGEIPVEMIGLCWLRDSHQRMAQIRRECPNWTLMTTTSPDLPRPTGGAFLAMLRCCTQSP